jgi:cytochrome bd-I ubiquinol oxidase subunit X
MWYFSWILGTGLALAFGVLNAMWYELTQDGRQPQHDDLNRAAGDRNLRSPPPGDRSSGLS